MYVSSLKLNNFRNYNLLELNPKQGVCLLLGKNAQGKTNLIESLALASTARSHRTPHDRDMINYNADFARAAVESVNRDGVHTVDIVLTRTEKKRIKVNGLPIARIGDMFGHIKSVMFSPEDLNLIKEGPSQRRRFIDIFLTQINPSYFYALTKYNHILEQRNNLLKQIAFGTQSRDTLSVWDEMLGVAALPVYTERERFVNRLSPVCKETHAAVSNGHEELRAVYVPSGGGDTDGYIKMLHAMLESDIKRGATGAGPHKDDISLTLGDIDLRFYGSQGQQRTAALALKLSQLKLMEQDSGEPPILLLDDVLSELDEERQHQLLKRTEGIQTFITAAQFFPAFKKIPHTVYNVADGKIT